MSRTLNLIDVLLNSGRHFTEIGRTQEAIAILTRLAEFRKLPREVLEELHALLADLYLRQADHTKARRHLSAALAAHPLNAEHHYMMAVAIEEDDDADLKRAEMYYARAVELEPDNAWYWADYGSFLLRAGKRAPGLTAIRKAYALGIDDAELVAVVADSLRLEERFDEAGTKLRATLFRNHGDHRFRQLWQHHQFQRVRHEQEMKRAKSNGGNKGPVVLPFIAAKSTGKYADLGGKTIRIDQAEPVSDPKTHCERETPSKLPYRRPPKG